MKFSLYNERKYLLLRKKLDELHYSLPLQMESAELVERLLADYIKTSEGFQKLKKTNQELEQQLSLQEKSLIPLEQENKKLVRENNQLHEDIISAKENALQKDNLYQLRLKGIESETNDLKFVLQQAETRSRRLEDENLALKNKLDVISAKVYIPSSEKGFDELPKVYQNANIRNTANISISKENKSGASTLLAKSQRGESNYETDVSRLGNIQAKQRNETQDLVVKIQDLERQVKTLKEQVAKSESETNFVKVQLENREMEIKRIRNRIDVGGVNKEKLATDYLFLQQNEKISLLGSQIDFLNKENERMDNTLRSQKTLSELSSLNIKLQIENTQLGEQLSLAQTKTLEAERKLDTNYQSRSFAARGITGGQ